MESKTKNNITLIQLTRTGDIIQTLQAAKNCKAQRPDILLTLIAVEEMASPIIFLIDEIFDHYFYIKQNSLLSEDYSKSAEDYGDDLKKFIHNINQIEHNVCINLSFSKPSSYISSTINSKFKLGPWYDEDHLINIPDKWSQHVYASVLGGPLNPFSLVDIYSNIIGVNYQLEEDCSNSNKQSKHIVIHPFASIDKKRWHVTKWADVIYSLLKNDSDITIELVGGEEDIAQANTILTSPIIKPYKKRISNLVGVSSVENVFKALKNATLFVGHDSMVGHLASLSNTKSLTVSLGPVRPIETTPYGNENYILTPQISCFPCKIEDKCKLTPCHSKIPYQVIVSTIEGIIKNNDITEKYLIENNNRFHLDTINLYKTEISEINFLWLKPILNHHSSIREVFRTIYRTCWNYYFLEKEEFITFPLVSEASHIELKRYLKGLQYLFDLCEFGKKYSSYILEDLTQVPPPIDQIKKYSAMIDEIDKLQNSIKTTYPSLAPIIDFFQVAKSNLQGTSLVALTENSYVLYTEYGTLTSIIHELIEKIIIEHEIRNKHTKSIKHHGGQAV